MNASVGAPTDRHRAYRASLRRARPRQAAPVQAAPVQAAPVQAAPVQAAPVQAAPVQAAPEPTQAAPALPGSAPSAPTGAAWRAWRAPPLSARQARQARAISACRWPQTLTGAAETGWCWRLHAHQPALPPEPCLWLELAAAGHGGRVGVDGLLLRQLAPGFDATSLTALAPPAQRQLIDWLFEPLRALLQQLLPGGGEDAPALHTPRTVPTAPDPGGTASRSTATEHDGSPPLYFQLWPDDGREASGAGAGAGAGAFFRPAAGGGWLRLERPLLDLLRSGLQALPRGTAPHAPLTPLIPVRIVYGRADLPRAALASLACDDLLVLDPPAGAITDDGDDHSSDADADNGLPVEILIGAYHRCRAMLYAGDGAAGSAGQPAATALPVDRLRLLETPYTDAGVEDADRDAVPLAACGAGTLLPADSLQTQGLGPERLLSLPASPGAAVSLLAYGADGMRTIAHGWLTRLDDGRRALRLGPVHSRAAG